MLREVPCRAAFVSTSSRSRVTKDRGCGDYRDGLLKRVGWIIGGGVVLVVVVALGLSVCFWDTLLEGESVSAVVRNVALVAGGVIAIPLAVWRSIVASRQIESIEKQIRVSQDGALDAQFLKAAEMLGHDQKPVKMGGVYTLANIANSQLEGYGGQAALILSDFGLDEATVVPNRDAPLAEYKGSPEGAIAWALGQGIQKRLRKAGIMEG